MHFNIYSILVKAYIFLSTSELIFIVVIIIFIIITIIITLIFVIITILLLTLCRCYKLPYFVCVFFFLSFMLTL
jgi:hypothetical protein